MGFKNSKSLFLTMYNFVFSRRVRTLYACVGENETELTFEPNQIIVNGNNVFFSLNFVLHNFLLFGSTTIERAWLAGGSVKWTYRSYSGKLRGVIAVNRIASIQRNLIILL